MSSLDDFKDALASAGYSPEQIEDAEQYIIRAARASISGIEMVAHAALCAFWTMKSFRDCMNILQACPGISADELERMSQGLAEFGKLGSQPLPSIPIVVIEKTRKVPYYQKNKQYWWK